MMAKVCGYLLILAWKAKIIHNDLHVGNVLIDEKENIKIIDFDCVKVRAYVGDITESQNDVILNPTDKDLHLDGNVNRI